MVSARSLLLVVASLSVTGVSAGCGTDNCLQAARKYPWINCEFSSLCESLLHSTPKTKTVFRTSTCHKTITAPGATTTVSAGTTLAKTGSTISVSQTATLTETQTVVVLPTTTVFPSVTVTVTNSIDFDCSTTVTSPGAFTTSVIGYVTRSSGLNDRDVKEVLEDRDEMAIIARGQLSVAKLCNDGCDGRRTPFSSRLSSACSCFLTTPTKYKTTTVTKTATVTGLPHTTVVRNTAYTTLPGATVTAIVTQTVTAGITQGDNTATQVVTVTGTASLGSCTSTSTSTVYTIGGGNNGGALTCGAQTFSAVPSASTSGDVSCTATVPLPSQNALFRIEGVQSGEGTIFESCIVSGPRVITTPSGGSHQCDGTNDAANPFPGTTPTDMIDAAGRLAGFGFDGSYSNQYQDYFITSISASTQSGSQYWGVLNDLIYTPTGGCQYISEPGTETEWIFNAFNYNSFLRVSPGYAAAEAGSGIVIVTVSATNGNGGSDAPRAGASFGNQISAADGTIALEVPSQPGCYQYKATQNGAGPSNGFFLAVLPEGSFA